MTKRTIELAAASVAELRAFATDVLNLDIGPNDSPGSIRAAIMAVHDGATIELDMPDAAPKRRTKDAPASMETGTVMIDGNPVAVDANGKVWVMIHEDQDDPDGIVPLAVNGTNLLVPRGVPAPIRPEYYEALLHTVQRVPIVNRDLEVTGWRNVPAYAFSVLPPQVRA